MSLGEALAGIIENELMVEIGRLGEIQKSLEQAVDMGRAEEVLSPGDVRDFLGGVIDDDGEVIRSSDVLTGEDDIAQ